MLEEYIYVLEDWSILQNMKYVRCWKIYVKVKKYILEDSNILQKEAKKQKKCKDVEIEIQKKMPGKNNGVLGRVN